MRLRAGFNLVETLAVLLVVALGLAAAAGLFSYGLRLSIEAQTRSTAMATAISIACDPRPLLDPDLVPDWVSTTYDFDESSAAADPLVATDSGLVNGYQVFRRESTVAADIIAVADPATYPAMTPPVRRVYARSVQVDVEVLDAAGGKVLASFTTRFVRQRPEAP
jgi:prepilin-type N-terminal cleavage/methylation domain-containing protein